MALWREGARERKRERRRSRDESKKGESLNEERGQTAPFIGGWAILQCGCGEEHTWLLSGNCEGRV